MNGNIDDPLELVDAEHDVLTEIIREAELYLAAQLTASLAADQRALNFSGLLSAAAVAFGAGGATLILAERSFGALGWTCLAMAGVFTVAVLLSNLAAMPADFWFAGNTPNNWVDDVRNRRDLRDSLADQARHYAHMINANNAIMTSNNRQMSWAVWVAWFGLAVGVIFGGILLATR